MADISKISLSGAEYDLKDAAAREGLSDLETAQRALASTQDLISGFNLNYVLTTDTHYLRYKQYYSKNDNNTYTLLIIGTDYSAGDAIEADTVYETNGASITDMAAKLNEVIGVINTMIPAHRVIATE